MGNYSDKNDERDINFPSIGQLSPLDEDITSDIRFLQSPLTTRNMNSSITVASKKIFEEKIVIQTKSEEEFKQSILDENRGGIKKSVSKYKEEIGDLVN